MIAQLISHVENMCQNGNHGGDCRINAGLCDYCLQKLIVILKNGNKE